jgi:hypothetical protein
MEVQGGGGMAEDEQEVEEEAPGMCVRVRTCVLYVCMWKQKTAVLIIVCRACLGGEVVDDACCVPYALANPSTACPSLVFCFCFLR